MYESCLDNLLNCLIMMPGDMNLVELRCAVARLAILWRRVEETNPYQLAQLKVILICG